MGTAARWLLVVAVSSAASARAGTDAWQTELARAREVSQGLLPEEDAAGAVDGQISGRFSFHTGQDENPYWQVDLGAVHDISRVAIHNPHVPERAARLKLMLSDDGSRWRQVYQHDDTPATGGDDKKPLLVPLSQERARFVRVQVPGRIWLHLDEVQVFAADGQTNLALNKPATQSSTSQWSTRSIRIDAARSEPNDSDVARKALEPVLRSLGALQEPFRAELNGLIGESAALADPRWASLYGRAVALRQRVRAAHDGLQRFDPRAMRMAIDDMAATHPARFGDVGPQLARLSVLEARVPELIESLASGADGGLREAEAVLKFQREVLLANPLLDFDRLLVLRRNLGGGARSAMSGAIGMAANFHANDTVAPTGWDNEIAVVSGLRGEPQFTTLYRPEGGRFVGDLKLDFDARRLLFASVGQEGRAWRIFEIGVDGQGLVQVTPDEGADVSHSDPCYLPDGRILFASTANYVALPCVFGSAPMVSLYRLDRATGEIRQLTFEQDSDWCPTVTNSGRVMYLRWEYADLPHSNSRILFHMNPDGTGQMEYFGSNSYFPPSFFYAQPVPGHSSMVAGIVTGHHGTHRSGRLLLVDPARGRHEADGVVQEIPGWGQKVEPIVADRIVDGVWPQLLHPLPLSEKYFLVAMKSGADSLWGIYLADVFDNLTLVTEVEGAALLQPVPLQPRPGVPVVADKIDLQRDDATVLLGDVYHGPGLAGVPRGQVKQLRVISYYWCSRGMGGLLGSIGMDGPWDIKRVLGTVPVEADGSAHFRIPANKPITLQPLDAEGKALQLKRTWIVGMPGETVSCAGCHEPQNTVPPARQVPLAAQRAPSAIEPWYGPPRGFAFHREVQPVLDRRCVGCHNGQPRDDGAQLVDLRGSEQIDGWNSQIAGHVSPQYGGRFSVSYAHLHRYVRRPGIESDMHLLTPGEFHADTTELVQMLRDGRHHGVELDAEEWDRLNTWIDLNAPYHGTWGEIVGSEAVARVMPRRLELSQRYAGVAIDYEAIFEPQRERVEPILPERPARPAAPVALSGWPFDAAEAQRRQGAAEKSRRVIDLGEGVQLELVSIPAGSFVMGQAEGSAMEAAPQTVKIERAFWMGRFEVTNAQFARFDPDHDSRRESRHGYQFGRLGYPLQAPDQPVIRVSWQQAGDFCRWLSNRTGLKFALPTEEQWEWACRAGSSARFSFGDLDADYSAHANLGDIRLKEYAACTARGGYALAEVLDNPGPYDDWVPRDTRIDDGHFLSAPVGSYAPNSWGLHDMHGNVWEWTRTASTDGRMFVRGGSWRDRPHRATAGFRQDYRPYHKVFNVGFRVTCEIDTELAKR